MLLSLLCGDGHYCFVVSCGDVLAPELIIINKCQLKIIVLIVTVNITDLRCCYQKQRHDDMNKAGLLKTESSFQS